MRTRLADLSGVILVLAVLAAAQQGVDAQRGATASGEQAAQQRSTSAIPGFIGNPVAPPPMNIPPGFTPVFNGVNLTGWHVSTTNHHGITPDYHVMDGMIVGTQQPLGSGGILLTDKSYKNVEVYMEVKPDWGCDSGLFLRSSEAGDAYQVTLDYLAGGGLGAIYGEGLQGVGGGGRAAGTGARGGAPAPARGNAAPGRAAQGGAPAPQIVGGIPLGSSTPVGDAPWMEGVEA